MRIEVKTPGRPLTAADVTAAEARLGVRFPQQYVEFLLAQNGGAPRETSFRALDENDDGVVHFFYSIDGNFHTDLVGRVEYYREGERARADLLPIARTPSGDQICVCVGDVDAGVVFLWTDENVARSQQGWRLANSLDEFLQTLHRSKGRQRGEETL